MVTRREFVEGLVVSVVSLTGTTAKSYTRIAGANDRLNFASSALMDAAMLISRRSRPTRTPPASRISAMWTAIFLRSSQIALRRS